MSKRTVKKTVNMPGMEEEEDEAQDIQEDAMEEAVKDFADGERYVKLYRHPSELSGGRPRLLCALSREDFNDVLIQERFGGGKYFGRWRNRKGQYTRFNFEIDGEPKVLTRAQEDALRQEEEAERKGPYSFLNRRQDTEEESTSSGRDGISTFELLQIIAETRKESREEMRMFFDAIRPAQTAPDATEKVFSLVEKLAPLISQSGNDGGGNPWLFALSQLKEPLMKIVDTIQVAVTKPPQPAPGVNVPVNPAQLARTVHPGPSTPEPEPSAQTPTPEPINEDDMLAASFKPYLGLLTKAASEGQDTGLYCDLILAQIPPFAYTQLRDWLLKPGCLDTLSKHSPEMQAQRTNPTTVRWWESLRGLLVSSLNEELGDGNRNLQPLPDSDPSTSGPADSA